MAIPDTLRYSPHHLWVAPQTDGTVLAGLTDFAQQTLGDIVFVEAPAPGLQLVAGQPCGVVESVKTASDLHAPLDGLVLETNAGLASHPEALNDTPYESWIFRMQPARATDAASLLTAADYAALVQS